MGILQKTTTTMKSLTLVVLTLLGLVCLSQAKVISTSEGCPTVLLQKCVGQIASVVEQCEDLTSIFECISDILGIASDCLPCICDVLEIIPGIEVCDCPEL